MRLMSTNVDNLDGPAEETAESSVRGAVRGVACAQLALTPPDVLFWWQQAVASDGDPATGRGDIETGGMSSPIARQRRSARSASPAGFPGDEAPSP